MAHFNFDKPISELYKDFLNVVFEEVYKERKRFYETLNQSEKEKVFDLLKDNYFESNSYAESILKSPCVSSERRDYLTSFSEDSFSAFLSLEYSNAVENEYEEIIDNKYKEEIMGTLFHEDDYNIDNLKDKIKSIILDLEYHRFKDILRRI